MKGMYKKLSELSCWDLDRSCRHFVNQNSPANRRLKKILSRQDRKRLDRYYKMCYNDLTK